MSANSCEYPVVIALGDVDRRDHVPLHETALAWDALVVLLVTALSSYVF